MLVSLTLTEVFVEIGTLIVLNFFVEKCTHK